MKKVLSFILLIFMLISLSSCHGGKKKSDFVLPDSFDSSKNHEITFWAKNDTNKTQIEIYKKAIESFEALYPNIKVNIRLYTDYNLIYNDVITNISTSTTPNVCITYPDHIATYMTGENVVVPLDGLIDDPKYGLGGSELKFDSPKKDEVISKYLDECRISGTTYALPFMRSTEACYVNRTYVEALGFKIPEILTWDFIWEVSEKATEKNADGTFKINGDKVMIPFIYKSTDNMMIQYLKQSNAGYSDEFGSILLFNDTAKDFLNQISEHTKSGAFSTFKISGYPANFLNAGQCIFAIDSTAGSTWMGSRAPLIDIAEDKLMDFDIEVMPVPQVDPEKPQMISQGPSVCVFMKDDPDEVLASWLFAEYLMTNDVQVAYSQTEGYVPTTAKAQNSREYTDYLSRCGEDNNFYYDVKIKAVSMLNSNIENTFTTPVWNGSTSLRNASGDLIESVTKSTRRKETVDDEYFEKLRESTISLYRLDQSAGKKDLGKLPKAAIALIVCLSVTWISIIAYFIIKQIKSNRKA